MILPLLLAACLSSPQYSPTPTVRWNPVPEPVDGYTLVFMPEGKIVDLPCGVDEETGRKTCRGVDTDVPVQRWTNVAGQEVDVWVAAYNEAGVGLFLPIRICAPSLIVFPLPMEVAP